MLDYGDPMQNGQLSSLLHILPADLSKELSFLEENHAMNGESFEFKARAVQGKLNIGG